MKARTTIVLVAAALLASWAAPAGAQPADRDCASFPNQAAAQAFYDANPEDPNNLDADGDGIACEDTFGEPGSPTPEDTGTATGGVETGFGGLSGDDGSPGALPLVVALTASALAGTWILLRRRSAPTP